MRNLMASILFALFLTLGLNGFGRAPSPTEATYALATMPPTQSPIPEGKTLTVTRSADSGPGTLRQALLDAQPYDTITFDPAVFPTKAPATIVLSSGLPGLTQGHLTIDASNAGVILNGSNITTPESQHGISISSDYNIVRGLQIVRFSDAGIALGGGVQYNLIGGDPRIGNGPLGQGNLLSGNVFGVGLWDEATSHNTIQGNSIGITLDGTATWGNTRDGVHSNGATQNLVIDNVIGGSQDAGIYLCCVVNGNNTVTNNWIGMGPGGSSLGNNLAGVLIDRTHYNVVGPGNVIAHNTGQGVMFWPETSSNTITENSIHDNGERGILLPNPGQSAFQPVIINFDINAGTVSGLACANCTVEIFSDTGDEGGIYEGRTKSGEDGAFTFAKGTSLAGPNLTATATQTDGSTSEFSPPTQGSSQNLSPQAGNALPIFLLQTRPPNELADNRIGGVTPALNIGPGEWNLGLKWERLIVDISGKWQYVDWSKDEYVIDPNEEEAIDNLVSNGLRIMLVLDVWFPYTRTVDLKTESGIAIYSNWVRFMVRHFKGRVEYYEILNAPEDFNTDGGMPVESYTYLVKRIAPIIREEDPQAKIVVGTVDTMLDVSRDWMLRFLKSEVMPLVDGVSWHPMYGAAPSDDPRGVLGSGTGEHQIADYWENYPALVKGIKSTATAHGFDGEFLVEEMIWRTPDMPDLFEPYGFTDVAGAKYYARAIIIHLGLDVAAGLAIVQENTRPRSNSVIRYLCSIMAGAEPIELPIVIESEAGNLKHYGFSQSNGDFLVAVWRDDAAVDVDPGIASIISIPGFSNWNAAGMDVLNGFEQELTTSNENGSLMIRDLLIKDYPFVIRLSATDPRVRALIRDRGRLPARRPHNSR